MHFGNTLGLRTENTKYIHTNDKKRSHEMQIKNRGDIEVENTFKR